MSKLTPSEYQRLFKAYRQDRMRHPNAPSPTSIFGKWGWDLKLERDFQRDLKAQGIEWERKQIAQSSARAGSLKALLEKERALCLRRN